MPILMKSSRFVPLLLVILATCAQAGIEPDFDFYSSVEYDFGAAPPAVLRVRPDGEGPGFTEAVDAFGNDIDACLTLYLRNYDYEPVPDYPAEDMWLEPEGGGLAVCGGYLIADGPTDAEGVTIWSAPPTAGGSSESPVHVLINGVPLQPGIPLHFNSPDLDGDLNVGLPDLAMFAADFFGQYAFRSDLDFDNVLNIADLARMAQAYGAICQ